MIRIFLADDHRMVRTGLRLVLESQEGLTVVGEAGDGWSTLRELERPELDVDVLVLDVSMPRLGGLEVLDRALQIRPSLAVLACPVYPAEHYAARLIASGARGYVSKNASEAELVAAVRAAAAGEAPHAASERAPAPQDRLSAREMQIFLMIVTGSSVMDVAAELGVGQSTVSTHLARIRTKLGAKTVADLVSFAHREGLIG